MDNKQVILLFLQRKEGRTPLREIHDEYKPYRGHTLQSIKTKEGFQLVNYSTTIASIKNDSLVIDVDIKYYSNTTRKVQAELLRQLRLYNIDFSISNYDLASSIDRRYIINNQLMDKIIILGMDSYGLCILDILYEIEDSVILYDAIKRKIIKRIVHYDDEESYFTYSKRRCYFRDFLKCI